MEEPRNLRIDVLKGFLIITVMITNFGDLNGFPSPYMSYILYTFHMPLFLAISGYLISTTTLNLPFLQFFKRYWHRIIFPTILAWCVYYFLWTTTPSAISILYKIEFPMFHLWYVYNLLVSSFILWLFYKFRFSADTIFFAGSCVTIIAFILITIPQTKFVVVSYQLYYFVFFAFGHYIRQTNMQISHKSLRTAIGCLIVLWVVRIVLAEFNRFQKLTADFFLLNIVSVVCFLSWIAHKDCLAQSNKLLIWIGENSLPIYLWHPLIATLVKSLMLSVAWQEWLVGMILYGIFLVCVYYLNQNQWICTTIFGKIKKKCLNSVTTVNR